MHFTSLGGYNLILFTNFEIATARVLAETLTLTLTAVSPKTYGAQAKLLAALKSNPRNHGELQIG